MARSRPAKKIGDHFFGFLEMLYKDVRDDWLGAAKRKIHRKLLEARERLIGQSVAVVGPPAAGKTTLLKVFKNPNAEEQDLIAYEATEFSPNTAFKVDFNLTLDEGPQVKFRFKVRKNADVGGEEYLRDGKWKDVVRDANVLVYVVDWPRLARDSGGEYKLRIKKDFEWILQNTQLLKPKFKVVLVGNKIDELCTASNFRAFRTEHQPLLDQLRQEVASQWPEHLSSNWAPALLLSLLSKTLRQFTLNALMLSFIGADLEALLRDAETATDKS